MHNKYHLMQVDIHSQVKPLINKNTLYVLFS